MFLTLIEGGGGEIDNKTKTILYHLSIVALPIVVKIIDIKINRTGPRLFRNSVSPRKVGFYYAFIVFIIFLCPWEPVIYPEQT